MKIVLDTNVLVSGLLTPFGPGGEIVRMVSAGKLILYLDARILLEYQEVLYRPKFKFNKDHVNMLLDFIKQYGQYVSTVPLKNRLPDLDDEPFLEAAIAGKVLHDSFTRARETTPAAPPMITLLIMSPKMK